MHTERLQILQKILTNNARTNGYQRKMLTNGGHNLCLVFLFLSVSGCGQKGPLIISPIMNEQTELSESEKASEVEQHDESLSNNGD